MKDIVMSRRRALYNTVFIAMFAAVLCVLSPWSIPVGVIPITLGTLAVYLTGGILGSWRGACATLLYLFLGLIGLPVFSGLRGGPTVLFGYTGGYLFGYLPCVLLVGLSRYGKQCRTLLFAVCCVGGTLLCYLFGTAWYILLSGVSPAVSVKVCVIPFLPLDGVKILLATALIPALRRALTRPISLLSAGAERDSHS